MNSSLFKNLQQNDPIIGQITKIGKIGSIFYGLIFGFFLLALISLILPASSLGSEFTNFEKIAFFLLTTLSGIWFFICRRFNKEKLLTPLTANLIFTAVLLSVSLSFFDLIDFPTHSSEIGKGCQLFTGIVEALFDGLPLLAFAWVMKLAVSLKNEIDLTV